MLPSTSFTFFFNSNLDCAVYDGLETQMCSYVPHFMICGCIFRFSPFLLIVHVHVSRSMYRLVPFNFFNDSLVIVALIQYARVTFSFMPWRHCNIEHILIESNCEFKDESLCLQSCWCWVQQNPIWLSYRWNPSDAVALGSPRVWVLSLHFH